jgi:hypothetical protein
MHACILKDTHLGRECRFHKVIVRPDPSQADRAQGYVQAARAMLPQMPGLMLFGQPEKMRCGCHTGRTDQAARRPADLVGAGHRAEQGATFVAVFEAACGG